MAIAYFVTFTTYGTWLHGSEKGSVDRNSNRFEEPYLQADKKRHQIIEDAMKQPPYQLSQQEREIVRDAIVALAEERGWKLIAIHVRSNHVHLVLWNPERDPGRIMSDFKAAASKELTRAGYDDSGRKRWTRHGSTRHLFREDEVEAAVRYTLEEQGEAMATWNVFEPEPCTQ